jgi:chemotaxis protein histidine kinase CheA
MTSIGPRHTPSGPVDPLAEVRKEFSQGLPERLEAMQGALAVLRDGYDAGQAEIFYHRAHSLKGTAASFEANELAEHAAVLSGLGRSWMERGAVKAAELEKADAALHRLDAAIQAYRREVEGESR